MYSETSDRIQRIRAKVLAGKASIAELDAQVTDNCVKQLLRQASNSFDDVEVLWLGVVLQERTPPRTLAEESRYIDHLGARQELTTSARLN